MSTPFLWGFTEVLVAKLIELSLLDIVEGQQSQVVGFVAEYLNTSARGGSVISSFSTALIRCPFVNELYADDLQIKEIIDDLASVDAGRT